MKRNSKYKLSSKRRYRKFAWIIGSSAIVVALLYWEHAAILYVLSTLAMCAILLIVAFSNLEAKDNETHQATLEEMDRDAPLSSPKSKKTKVA